jgi:hypothetical protein
MIRIVPSRVRLGSSIMRRGIECLIYFGQPIHDFSGGTEQQWADLLAMESALLTAAQQAPNCAVIYQETILDEDRIDAYKLLAIRCRVDG